MTAPAKRVESVSAAFDAANPTAPSLLIVDLDAICVNYRMLRDMARPATCAAVVKANAYGTGANVATAALAAEGCDTFFVATFQEGLTVRDAAPDAKVYVLDGLFPGACEDFTVAGLVPVLSSFAEAMEWIAFCNESGVDHTAGLHIDTGMNRLGLRSEQAIGLFEDDATGIFRPELLISHLARADEPANPMNARQLAAFNALREKLPPCPASFANSGGIFLGSEYHLDLVRAGFALYGGEAVSRQAPLNPVVHLYARIARVDEAEAGESVGYGAAQTLERKTRIATIAAGYADGIFRCLGAGNPDTSLVAFIGDAPAPVLGRISMDLISLDVTDITDPPVERGGWVELLGPHISIDDLARRAGTIGYEILTGLNRRAQCIYIDTSRKAA